MSSQVRLFLWWKECLFFIISVPERKSMNTRKCYHKWSFRKEWGSPLPYAVGRIGENWKMINTFPSPAVMIWMLGKKWEKYRLHGFLPVFAQEIRHMLNGIIMPHRMMLLSLWNLSVIQFGIVTSLLIPLSRDLPCREWITGAVQAGDVDTSIISLVTMEKLIKVCGSSVWQRRTAWTWCLSLRGVTIPKDTK